MYPSFTLPGTGITISTYDVALALAVIVCVAIGPAWTQSLEGIDARTTRRVLLWLGLVTFAGGRTHFVAANWHLFAGQPLAALKVWSGGFHAPGAIGFLALGAVPILRWQKGPVGKVLDGLVPTMGLGIATARLGCLLHGCCFGAVCNWAWCITFPEGS
jgi:phosphatidylglycerol:prolipoprotein diacylglycerol transferase